MTMRLTSPPACMSMTSMSRMRGPILGVAIRGSVFLPFRVRDDDEVADETLGHEFGLSAVEIRQLVGAVQQGADRPVLDVADKTFERTAGALRRPVKLQMLQVHRAQIQGHH